VWNWDWTPQAEKSQNSSFIAARNSALKVCTPEPVPRESPVGNIYYTDYNFDGHSDLALEVAFKEGNASYCVWLFDSKTGRFVASPQLSRLTNPSPDPNNRTVTS
jgi:hypothetical protein